MLLGIFVVWPAIYAAYLSFQDWSFYKPAVFVAFKNYTDVLKDPLFIAAIKRGFMFVLFTVPTTLVLAFLFSSLVVSVSRRFADTLKVSIYLPTIISGVITSIIFVLIYDYSGGILNWFLGFFGVEPIAWLGDPQWALLAIAVPVSYTHLTLPTILLV